MAYDVITIDAQTVYASSGELKTGIVGQLTQYQNGPVKVVLTEIVLREIHKLRKSKAQAVIDKQRAVIRDGEKSGLITGQPLIDMKACLDALSSAEDHARTEMQDFVTGCGADIIPAKLAKTEDIIKPYFRGDPPFSGKGKKNEFPDAISLMSLKAWAIENNLKVLAVSKDGDWESFAESCEQIDVVKDLGDAMVSLTQEADKYLPHAKKLVANIRKGAGADGYEEFMSSLDFSVSAIMAYADFDGPMPGEVEETFMTLRSFELLPLGDEDDIEIIRIGPEKFVARAPISVAAQITAQISFAVYDSIDKDYVPMGSTEVERDVDFDTSALIHVFSEEIEEGGADKTVWLIEQVELLEEPQSFDLGYVDYSLADEYGPDEWDFSEDDDGAAEA